MYGLGLAPPHPPWYPPHPPLDLYPRPGVVGGCGADVVGGLGCSVDLGFRVYNRVRGLGGSRIQWGVGYVGGIGGWDTMPGGQGPGARHRVFVCVCVCGGVCVCVCGGVCVCVCGPGRVGLGVWVWACGSGRVGLGVWVWACGCGCGCVSALRVSKT